METIQRNIEVERITNLVRGFGWEVIEIKTEGDVLQITIKKTVIPLPPAAA